jgi:hypothetical protein
LKFINWTFNGVGFYKYDMHIPGMGEGGIKENGGRGEFKYDAFDTL